MTTSETNFAIKFCSISGVLGAIVYPLMISTHGYNWWNFLFEMSFGPLFMLSNIGLYLFIKKHGDSFFNLLAVLFNVLAGSSVLLMLSVQKSVFSLGRNMKYEATDVSQSIYRSSFQVGNLTQLGLDFYFDVLVSIGTVFLALAIKKQDYFPKWFSWFGLFIGAGGLIVNTSKFPIPPADTELFDPGPFYAVFLSILLVGIIKNTFFKKKNIT